MFKNFVPTLSGNQMLIATMKNKAGTQGTATQTFVVDDQGPTFTGVSHKAGDLIGGTIKVAATIKDAGGVLDSSVKCVIGKALNIRIVDLKLVAGTTDQFEALFDARLLGIHDLYPVMSFRASDKLGNESHLDITVVLDNGPPLMELDPPPNLHMSKLEKSKLECSYPFDPVGADAINDEWQVPQISNIRVRAEDQGNIVPSATYGWVSGLDETNVFLYVLDDTTKPLVVDSDDDGYCDRINPEIVPLGSSPKPGQAVAVKLDGIPPSGGADFSVKGTYLPKGCSSWGTATSPPEKKLCQGVPAYVAPPARCVAASTKAIFTIPKISGAATGYTCMGLPFDFLANKFDPGWVCAAVAMQDKLGNKGISPPLRAYVNYSSNKACSSDGNCLKGETCKEVVIGTTKTKQCQFLTMTSVLPTAAGVPPHCRGTMDPVKGIVNPNKPCKFRDPREGSSPKTGKFNCIQWKNSHRQKFCHNEVVCP